MQFHEMKNLARSNQISAVRFIESGCSPIVIELNYRKADNIHRELLMKDDEVFTCRCLEQAYCLCRKAGIHNAELVQTFTHDETESGSQYQQQNASMPLTF